MKFFNSVHHPGGPAKPEVDYVLERDQKEILLSWPRPFSWKEYPVTGYGIECRDTESEKTIHSTTINDTETVNVVRQTVELPPDIPDCHTLQCSVTASNALDKSRPSISNISLPLREFSSFTLSVREADLRGSHHSCRVGMRSGGWTDQQCWSNSRSSCDQLCCV